MELYILILSLVLGITEMWNIIYGLYNVFNFGDTFIEGFNTISLIILNAFAFVIAYNLPLSSKSYLLLFSIFVGMIIGDTLGLAVEEIYNNW